MAAQSGVFYQSENMFSGYCKTITGIAGPEDIQLDEQHFYFTIDGRSRDKFVRSIDTFFYRGTGSVGYYDGVTFSIAETDLHFPNGIAFDSKTA
ncbi:MAG TPA: hypothetical protein VKM36_01680 [Balneolaceae bacterium]|nr:hypothetical protein [Balneolaceae bacterium]